MYEKHMTYFGKIISTILFYLILNVTHFTLAFFDTSKTSNQLTPDSNCPSSSIFEMNRKKTIYIQATLKEVYNT